MIRPSDPEINVKFFPPSSLPVHPIRETPSLRSSRTRSLDECDGYRLPTILLKADDGFTDREIADEFAPQGGSDDSRLEVGGQLEIEAVRPLVLRLVAEEPA